jgi:hypothetical protein
MRGLSSFYEVTMIFVNRFCLSSYDVVVGLKTGSVEGIFVLACHE